MLVCKVYVIDTVNIFLVKTGNHTILNSGVVTFVRLPGLLPYDEAASIVKDLRVHKGLVLHVVQGRHIFSCTHLPRLALLLMWHIHESAFFIIAAHAFRLHNLVTFLNRFALATFLGLESALALRGAEMLDSVEIEVFRLERQIQSRKAEGFVSHLGQ